MSSSTTPFILGDTFGFTHRLLVADARRRGEAPPPQYFDEAAAPDGLVGRRWGDNENPLDTAKHGSMFARFKKRHDDENALYVETFCREQKKRAEGLIDLHCRIFAPSVTSSPSKQPPVDGEEDDEVVNGVKNEIETRQSHRMLSMMQAPTAAINWLPIYRCYRRHVYMSHFTRWRKAVLSRAAAGATEQQQHQSSSSGGVGSVAELFSFYRLLNWCDKNNIFLHPSLVIDRGRSEYRDFTFTVKDAVAKFCPLIAVPESMCIGFKAFGEEGCHNNALHDEDREKNFVEASGMDDMDVCKFFFDALGVLVSDLLSALHSPDSDKRFPFAQSLQKVRSMMNAPYFDDDVVFSESGETCLADVLLQMIRNYINGGPMVGKVDRDVLRWAISIAMSHSTPLAIGSARSIGIIPVVHLMPHGGEHCNAVVIARNSRRQAGTRMTTYFQQQFGFDFANAGGGDSADDDPRWIYVVATRDLAPGETVLVQAMAPVCDKATEAAHMWRLSCGSSPSIESAASSKVSAMQQAAIKWIVSKGGEMMESASV